MQPRQIAGTGSIILGAAISASALLGPLILKTIKFRTSSGIEAQFMGSEVVSLAIVAPALIGAGVLWLKGNRLAPAIALGPALSAAYTYITVIAGQEYGRYPGNVERFLPLYAFLLGGSAALSVYAWRQLSTAAIQPATPGIRHALTSIFFGLAGFITLAWAAQIRQVMSGNPSAEYNEAPTLFWLIKALDFGFCIPALIATGFGLMRHASLADRAAVALAGFSTCLAGSIAGMAIVMEARGDPSASPALLFVMAPTTVAFGYVAWRVLQGSSSNAGFGHISVPAN